ncbi:hypothetical protein Pcinc_014852 [Petrolisthes cinctipes]|uniref:Fibronectin type-III domain-containing protein n=1 Tax=Petrolisthes cinctipes TaxID=88211 RepID=A0AAE1FX08_PETCI|nr:hypothetical protein Pcinc_014852 [Petrolisthes cinctipes]
MVNQSDSLAMNWTQAEFQGKCDITGNIITWSASNTGNQEMIEPTENYTITGLDPWTTYNVCVSAVNLEGQSPFAPCVNQTTDEDKNMTESSGGISSTLEEDCGNRIDSRGVTS